MESLWNGGSPATQGCTRVTALPAERAAVRKIFQLGESRGQIDRDCCAGQDNGSSRLAGLCIAVDYTTEPLATLRGMLLRSR